MYTGILHTHTLSVILFFLIYLVKTTLLLLDKKESLIKFSGKTKVFEIIISTIFLITGIYLAFNSGSIGTWFYVKLLAVFSSVPVAIIAFKRMNKILAILALALLLYAYGISETKSPSFKKSNIVTGDSVHIPTNNSGKAVYENNCMNCHGADGKSGLSGAKDLTISKTSRAEKIAVIQNGKNAMMGFKEQLSQQQIEAVAEYVEQLTLAK